MKKIKSQEKLDILYLEDPEESTKTVEFTK
jgi:hypothetical protein